MCATVQTKQTIFIVAGENTGRYGCVCLFSFAYLCSHAIDKNYVTGGSLALNHLKCPL